MGYTYNCDDCGRRGDGPPPFMGELRESFLKTADTALADFYAPGETLTLCRGCAEEVFL